MIRIILIVLAIWMIAQSFQDSQESTGELIKNAEVEISDQQQQFIQIVQSSKNAYMSAKNDILKEEVREKRKSQLANLFRTNPEGEQILEIKTGDTATGTGFMFSSSDYVITSYHVVHGSKSISVRFTNGEQIDATIGVKDTNNDIAILKLSKSPTSRHNIITLGDSTSVKTGDRVFTYGFPLVDLLGHQEPRYSEGFINSLSGISNDPRLFQVSIPIQPGNSGGPVFNEKGELIGIATSSIDAEQTKKVFGAIPQNVNFAIKSSYINSLLPNLPDTFIRKKGIIPVPIEQPSFKERVKNDIVLVEAVPEFKPTVVKRDYKEEERLRREQDMLQLENHSFIAKIDQMGANENGEISLKIKLLGTNSISLSNYDNGPSTTSPRKIQKGTEMYDVLAKISDDEKHKYVLKVHGHFLTDEDGKDYISERSSSLFGSIRRPEFSFEFTRIGIKKIRA